MFSKRKAIVIAISIFFLSLTNVTHAQSWIGLISNGNSPSAPTTRYEHTAIYDTTNNLMTIFGGYNGSSYPNDVWVLSTANGLGTPTWKQLSPTGSNSTIARFGHTAVYDNIDNRMTIFGGQDNFGFLNDVWVLTNANGLGGAPAWTQLSPTGSAPITRVNHTAVYDAANNRMIIFGGYDGGNSSFNDVWVLSTANGLGGTPAWTELNPNPDPTYGLATGRYYHTAVYDPTNNRMTIFGGYSDYVGTMNDVWVLSNANGLGGTPAWTQLSPTPDPLYGLPAMRYSPTAVYDPTNNRMTIFGGFSSSVSSDLNDVWVLSNANGLGGTPTWTQLLPTGSDPTTRNGHTAVYDAVNNRMIIFGGDNGNTFGAVSTLLNDVWVLSTANGGILPSSISITLTSNPPGQQIQVNGTNYTAPYTFSTTTGACFNIGAYSIESSTGTLSNFASWSDAGSLTHQVCPTSSTTYTANFNTQYYLTTQASPSNDGYVSPSSGWYNNGATVSCQAYPNSGVQFIGWSGALSGTANPKNVTMNGPKNVAANFYTNSIGSSAQVTYIPFNAGSGYSDIWSIAVGSRGDVYLSGYTYSTDFPVTPGAFQTKLNSTGGANAFVSIINISSGTASLVYSTYLGGSGNDQGGHIAIDSAGIIYICGYTSSTDFPITSSAFQTFNRSAGYNAYLSKINPSLSGVSSLLYSTYLGGSVFEDGLAVALDSASNAYITGYTESSNFPVTSNAFSTTFESNVKVFLSKINTTLSGSSSLVYSTLLGGNENDEGNAIVIDSEGNACITGETSSPDFPVTSNAFSTTLMGTVTVFISKINTSLSGASSLIYSSFLGGNGLGGSGYNDGYGITVDTAGFIYITGNTASPDFPVTSGAFQTINNNTTSVGSNIFLTKIDTNSSSTTTLLYSTFLGGTGYPNGNTTSYYGDRPSYSGIIVDPSGNAYITGPTSSADFPVTPDAALIVDPNWADYGAAYFSAINTNSSGTTSLVYSTYLWSRLAGDANYPAVAIDSFGNVYVAGLASSLPDIPSASHVLVANPAINPSTVGPNGQSFITKISFTHTHASTTDVRIPWELFDQDIIFPSN